jgi:hypothetical protein
MNVEHSSVNGSIKVDEERGYQKLPTDQGVHVIESKKNAGRKDQARTYLPSSYTCIARDAHHCSASRIREISSCNLDRNPLAGCPWVGKVEVSCSIF